jgi:hypothetical protein
MERPQLLERNMNHDVTQKVTACPDPAIRDSGKVRLGTTSPTFPPVRRAPATAADTGKLRLGFTSPSALR